MILTRQLYEDNEVGDGNMDQIERTQITKSISKPNKALVLDRIKESKARDLESSDFVM